MVDGLMGLVVESFSRLGVELFSCLGGCWLVVND